MKKSLLILSAGVLFGALAFVPLGAGASLARPADPPAFTVATAPADPTLAPYVAALLFAVVVILACLGIAARLNTRNARTANSARRVQVAVRGRVHVGRTRDPRPPVMLPVLALLLSGAASAADTVGGGMLDLTLTFVGSAATVALISLSAYVTTKSKLVQDGRLQHFITLAAQLGFAKVGQLQESVIEKLKGYAADGKLTREEAAAAFAAALKETWAALPSEAKQSLVRAAGSEQAALAAYVEPQISNAVRSLPRALSLPTLYGGAGGQQEREAARARTATLSEYNAARARLGLEPRALPARTAN